MSTTKETFALAWQYHRENDYPRAEQLYRQILTADSTHADAWCFLGAACQAQGKMDEAESAFRQAINLLPNHASALNCLGVLLAQQGKLAEGAVFFQKLLFFNPSDAEAHNNLGQVHARQGRINEAIGCYEYALRLRPDFDAARQNLNLALQQANKATSGRGFVGAVSQMSAPTVTGVYDSSQTARAANMRGVEFAKQGRLEEARIQFEEALRHDLDDPDAHNNLGNLLDMQGRLDEAASQYDWVLQVRPDYVEAHYNLGIVRTKQGKLEQACECYRRAIKLRPEHVDAQNNLAINLMELGRLEEAAKLLRQALKTKPTSADAWNNLGNIMDKLDNLDEASRCYQKAIQHQPQSQTAYNNLANVQKQQGRLDEASSSYDEAVHRAPDFAEAHFNRALLWLLQGKWSQGWPEYDWRWKTKDFPQYSFKQPRWHGEPLVGRTLFVLAEQGFGDTLQFIRYVPKLRSLGGRVIVQCHAPLRRLLGDCAGIDDLVISGASLPKFDTYAPLMSLPGILGTLPDSIPADVPYLHAEHSLVEQWRKELESLQGFKIGIAWQGRPTYRGDRLRSIPLTQFARLAEIPGVHLISLQKGAGMEQLSGLPDRIKVLDLGSRLDESSGAFMDTAAVMMNLDLVISSDTVIPHLAGALGIPVWVALNMIPDWRWLLHGEGSPWYPTMQLFRQKNNGRWDDVFEHMSDEVKTLATGLAN